MFLKINNFIGKYAFRQRCLQTYSKIVEVHFIITLKNICNFLQRLLIIDFLNVLKRIEMKLSILDNKDEQFTSSNKNACKNYQF